MPDDSAFNYFTDPSMMGLLGALQGASQYSGFSRLPVSFGQALGGAAGGLLGGIQAGQKYQQGQLEMANERLKNLAAAEQVRQNAAVWGQQIPSIQDLFSGKYSGIDWIKAYQDFQNNMQGDGGLPSAGSDQKSVGFT